MRTLRYPLASSYTLWSHVVTVAGSLLDQHHLPATHSLSPFCLGQAEGAAFPTALAEPRTQGSPSGLQYSLLPEQEVSCVLFAHSVGKLFYAQPVPNRRTHNLQIPINSSCRRNGLYIFMQRKNESLSPKCLLQQNKDTNVNMSKDHRCGPKILDNFLKVSKALRLYPCY